VNQRARNARYIIRQRRRDPWLVWVRRTLPNGVTVRVRRSETWADRADYRARYANVFGVYPPNASLMRELTRWQ
jgi:hypothetical protein